MKIYLQKVIFINRAPFDKLELDFGENEIAVLTAVNGKGKTTVLSYIVDAFYEMVRPNYLDFEDKKNKYYRVSSIIYNLNRNEPSFVYLRFKTSEGNLDYVDIRNICTEEQYNNAITIDNKIPFNQIKSGLEEANNVKKLSSTFNKKQAEEIINNNLLTYFPSYRYESPGYLNDPYTIQLDFKKQSDYSGYLKNPIEVVSGLPQLANWIMDVILDLRVASNSPNVLFENLNRIISLTLISKNYGPLRFGVGNRGLGSTRIQILENKPDGLSRFPSIFNLSSGEAAILSLFGEILRQADNTKNDISLQEIKGIVLIDEIDKHLHIKLQKEGLPLLMKLFPNVQFLVSSHSPFLCMGLAEEAFERTRVVDLDNFGISKDSTTNELYTEVYNMMIGENIRFKNMYQSLEKKIKEGTIPLIITEGKTDVKHLKKAKEILQIDDCDIEYFEPLDSSWGDSKLKSLLEHLSKVLQARKIIGIFDRDVSEIVNDIEKDNNLYKNYGNNVYSFCIPIPTGRELYKNISIEFYYTDEELKNEKDGKSLYFNNEIEFRQSASNTKIRKLVKLENINEEEEYTKKIFDENIGDLNWIHSKGRFAELIETDESFNKDFDFQNFNLIFDRIKVIINDTELSSDS